VEVIFESSIVGLGIQWAGIFLVAILSFLLTRSIRRDFFDYWTLGWGCLALGLSFLLIAFCLPVNPKVCYAFYFLGEYAFGYLFLCGCRNFASGETIRGRDLWALVPAGLVGMTLPCFSDQFALLMVPHAAIFMVFWITSYWVLQPARRQKQWGFGLKVMSVALILLTLDFFQYIPTCAYSVLVGDPAPFKYLKYSSLYDLILEILLGFGTIMLVMESIRGELEEANRELAEASYRLRGLAERDPLTQALNRYAFYSFLEEGAAARTEGGSVAILDVDDFKSINDTLGHCAGDAAIRAVAGAIRSVIRADDLLIRWGGDEFLVVLVGLPEAEARVRLDQINGVLGRVSLPGPNELVVLSVSYGLAAFADMAGLEPSIDRADREMYLRKQARKVVEQPAATNLVAIS
jgi:diguanylate cyclase (GGDEF)-like protein